MGKTCFVCGRKFGIIDKYLTLKDLKDAPVNILPSDFDTKDGICIPCYEKQGLNHVKEIIEYDKKALTPQEFDELYTTSPIHTQYLEKYNQTNSNQNTSTTPVSNSVGGTMPNQSSGTMPSGYEPPKTNSNSQNVSAAQLRGIAQAFHDQFKKDWDSTGVVQFKNNQIAILKRVWGQQVQFIVAYDHVTKEGYRLMAIDEGITAQGSGFSGGASAFFYFQRMDFVR